MEDMAYGENVFLLALLSLKELMQAKLYERAEMEDMAYGENVFLLALLSLKELMQAKLYERAEKVLDEIIARLENEKKA